MSKPQFKLQSHVNPVFDREPTRRRGGGPTLPTTRPTMLRGATTRNGGAGGLSRGKTLVRQDRHVPPAPLINPTASAGMPMTTSGPMGSHTATSATASGSGDAWYSPWPLFVTLVTLPIPGFVLSACGLRDPVAQQAWREKLTLCLIVLVIGGGVGFVTIGLNKVLCPDSLETGSERFIRVNSTPGLVGIEGWQFDVSSTKSTPQLNLLTMAEQESGIDVSQLFDRSKEPFPSCAGLTGQFAVSNLCANATSVNAKCTTGPPTQATYNTLGIVNMTKLAGYAWGQVAEMHQYIVIDGHVLNMNPYLAANPTPIAGDKVDAAIRQVAQRMPTHGGKDGTRLFSYSSDLTAAAGCLKERYLAGYIDKISPGCFVSQLFLYTSLVVILGLVMCRFAMAIFFSWFLSARLTRPPRNLKRKVISPAVMPEGAVLSLGNKNGAAPWVNHIQNAQAKKAAQANKLLKAEKTVVGVRSKGPQAVDSNGMISMASIGAELFCVCLVTCYSEGTSSIRTTLDSIAGTDYSDARKLMFVVCDGMITGSGERKSTPDICVEMLDADPRFGNPMPMGYRAVGAGAKEHNEAMVYAGHYTNVEGRRTPTIIIVKCGTQAEAGDKKPGNRGKRDSQMIVMNFFSRVTYNDRMTPLDYDLFRKMQALMGVTPDFFEVCLMVDADTKVARDSMTHLVNCMHHDPAIMGVCGETRIANKRQSWVTMIQVFEYYISHHLAKAFESVFGGVTCLPGCFSMYRLKARKKDANDWVPILAQPDICREYSQSTVTTLHQKNLLLLGEDRFLTTLMIRAFPARKMMFLPQARCRTVAPDEFRVLLSQRRRWINSTIHNLMELVRVPNLCGTFCFSMQFVVFMDLLGTVILPVAICLTYTLIINYAFNPPNMFSDAIPLLLLAAVLGLPAVLILMTTRKIIYVFWMGVYLLALPVWNFVLPLYAFWHFDDFSWGETRRVSGESKKLARNIGGVAAAAAVPMRRWEDWERSRLRKMRREEKRRREMERAFGNRGFHNAPPSSTFDTDAVSVMSSADGDDRWGMAIGNYDEFDYALPPVGLYSVDAASVSDGLTLHSEEMEQMLESGWADEPPSQDTSPARTPNGSSSPVHFTGPAPPQPNMSGVHGSVLPPPLTMQRHHEDPSFESYPSTTHLVDHQEAATTAVDAHPAWGHAKRRSGGNSIDQGQGYAR